MERKMNRLVEGGGAVKRGEGMKGLKGLVKKGRQSEKELQKEVRAASRKYWGSE